MNMIRAAAVLFLAAMLAACGSKVSEENYDKITVGMKEAEVGRILGVASESRSTSVKVDEVFTSTQSKWRGDKGTIVVVFFNGEVQSKMHYPPGAEPAPEKRY